MLKIFFLSLSFTFISFSQTEGVNSAKIDSILSMLKSTTDTIAPFLRLVRYPISTINPFKHSICREIQIDTLETCIGLIYDKYGGFATIAFKKTLGEGYYHFYINDFDYLKNNFNCTLFFFELIRNNKIIHYKFSTY